MAGSFYSNVCKLLSTLNGGIKHQRPSVKLPLSKVGLELSRILTNLGIIDDFSIGQRLGRVRAHSRLWDPTRSHISRSADAAGYPAMYLTLHLNYDKHKPLWCRTPLAAAPHNPADHLEYLPSSSSSSSSSIAAVVSSSSSSSRSVLPNPQNFTPPMGVNSPTPETVKIISKPSVQRWMGVGDLHRARKNSRPGIFLLSTHQGLLTDIDCELRGIGGTVLAHLGLPLGHVVQLRGLLRQKYLAEVQAALPPMLLEDGVTAKTLDATTEHALKAAGRVQHKPLAQWDARAASVAGLAERVQQQVEAGGVLVREALAAKEQAMNQAKSGRAAGGDLDLQNPHQLLAQAERALARLQLREAAWNQRDGSSSSSSDRGESRDAGEGGYSAGGRGSGAGRGRGRGGADRFRGGTSRQGEGGVRQGLFRDRQQQQGGASKHDSWQPDA